MKCKLGCGNYIFLFTAHQHQHLLSFQVDIFINVFYLYRTSFLSKVLQPLKHPLAHCEYLWTFSSCVLDRIFSSHFTRGGGGGLACKVPQNVPSKWLWHLLSHIQPPWKSSGKYLNLSACLQAAIKTSASLHPVFSSSRIGDCDS